ncbi:hypothetical protein PsorP6_007467 [Peronosclerospora sorghi]|uniref:Uncharacterized protein n=1 Tax=Peronosclerospora sorghi TaxID=230839 RepID=A0ACC0WA54_9STRA|nr:hypothetical protein PsorP6_007467 [Peronosclerospora sorghi]
MEIINPDNRDFTIPKRKNRLDFCFLTPDFPQHRFESVRHVRDTKWHNEDHIAAEFRLKAKILPRCKRQPWQCPPWLLKYSTVKRFLVQSAIALAHRLKSFRGANPDCQLDEHKRSDFIYYEASAHKLKTDASVAIHALSEDLKDPRAAFQLRQVEFNLSIQSARTHERWVQCIQSVCGHQHFGTSKRIESIQFRQQS